MKLSLIVAMAENGVIGHQGDLPWRLSADLRRFKRITMGHAMIMGRRTYESIGRPLPGRTSIVLTRQSPYDAPGALVVSSLPDAVTAAGTDNEVFVIGGAEVYRLALPQCTRIYLTRVATQCDGDTQFPPWDPSAWQLVEDQPHAADERNQFDYRFQIWERGE